MSIEPAEPSAKGTPIRINGVHTDAFVAEEGSICENKAESIAQFVVVQKGPELGTKYGAIDTASVETKYSWQI